jgi:hypothetical protein
VVYTASLLNWVTQGRKDAEHDKTSYAEHEKKVAENASARKNRYWFSKMKAVFKELDIQTFCIPRKGALKFLDLG